MIRTRVKRSPVWAYFDEGPSSASTVTCKLCDGKLARQSGTTNLFNHLKSHHNDKYLEVVGAKPPCSGDASKTAAGIKPVSTSFSSELKRPCDKNRAGVITDCILDWIVDSIRPLSIVSDKGLVHLMQVCEPSYSVPSRTYLTSLLDKRHKSCKQELIELLKSAGTAGVSLTTDGWSSSATQSFVTHTVHFINPEWELVSGVLETGLFQGSHTGVNLAEFSDRVVSDFGISGGTVVGICHDEAANMVAAARILCDNNDWTSHVCMAHRFQTVTRHALDLQNLSTLLARSRRLVGQFKHSCLATEALSNKQAQLDPSKQPLRLIQDVATRWNSSFYMLRCLLELRVAVTAVICDAKLTPKRGDRELLLKDSQWKLAEELTSLLEPFEVATTVISSQSYVTLSLLMPVVSHLYETVSTAATESSSATCRTVASILKSELKRKFPDTFQSHPASLPILCAALDPRFHHLAFLDGDKAAATKQAITDLLHQHKPDSGTGVETIEPSAKKPKPSGGLSRLLGPPARALSSSTDMKTAIDREVEL